jgi:threonine/homoserine/homoserine lactone efflux protein
LLGFYALLIGSKIGMAVLAGSGRQYLTQTWYRRVLAVSGVVLMAFGALLAWSVVG